MKTKRIKRVFSTAIVAMLTVSSMVAPAVADSTSVDVSDSQVVIRHGRFKKAADDSAPVNENRDAGDSPVVQPVASMRGQTCIAAGGDEVPCETDNAWFYAPESCYASKKIDSGVIAKNRTMFQCTPVGNQPSLREVSLTHLITVPTSEAEARATAAKKGSKLAEDALADYDFEKLVVSTQPSDANLRPDAFVFTQGYVWAWVPPSKARSSSKRNPIVVESTDGDAHVQLKISFIAMNVYFDGQKSGVQGFIQCDDPGPVYAGEPRGGSACSWKAKKQDQYRVTSSILYRVEWTTGDESGVLIHEVPMDGAQMIRVQDGYAVNVK